jgi:hypothetical protein
VPTSKPRYIITDTGKTSEMLDLASRTWPETTDRKQLLLRLAALGEDVINARLSTDDAQERERRQRRALGRAGDLVDAELVLSDAAWR